MNKFTAIYCRTSTSKQETGLESQKRALIEYCKNRLILDYKIYEDEGISGTKEKRPALDQILKDIEDNKIESVLVYSFSRMARSTKHLLNILDFFRTKNVSFVSITENIDTKSTYGKLFYTIIASISELERELIVERVKNGIANARSKGKRIGRPKKRNSKLILELHKLGYTQRKIAKLADCGLASVWREISAIPKPINQKSPWDRDE